MAVQKKASPTLPCILKCECFQPSSSLHWIWTTVSGQRCKEFRQGCNIISTIDVLCTLNLNYSSSKKKLQHNDVPTINGFCSIPNKPHLAISSLAPDHLASQGSSALPQLMLEMHWQCSRANTWRLMARLTSVSHWRFVNHPLNQ